MVVQFCSYLEQKQNAMSGMGWRKFHLKQVMGLVECVRGESKGDVVENVDTRCNGLATGGATIDIVETSNMTGTWDRL